MKDSGVHGDHDGGEGKDADQLMQLGTVAEVGGGGQGGLSRGADQDQAMVGQALGEAAGEVIGPGAGGVATFGGEDQTAAEVLDGASPSRRGAQAKGGKGAEDGQQPAELVGAVLRGCQVGGQLVQVDGPVAWLAVPVELRADGLEDGEPFWAGGDVDGLTQGSQPVENGQQAEDITQAVKTTYRHVDGQCALGSNWQGGRRGCKAHGGSIGRGWAID